jgi:hypothetical protein
MLVQDLEIQLLWPPVPIRGAATRSVIERAFRFS